MLLTNEHKLEVCEIFNDEIISGPAVLEYPLAGYLLPVEYLYDELDGLTQEYGVVTPEILPEKVLFHFKAQELSTEEQTARLTTDTLKQISAKRKALVTANLQVSGIPDELPGDLGNQYEVVHMYDESLGSDEDEFVVATVNGSTIVSKATLKEIAKSFTTRMQNAFIQQKQLEEKILSLNSLAKIKKFRSKEL